MAIPPQEVGCPQTPPNQALQPTGDALHLALASFHRVDVLWTWNCLHLANPNETDHIRLVNYELGLPTPLLTTPLNYLGGGKFDD